MIDISIVIVNWNTRKLLLECIESIYNQTNNSVFEIILVDNASQDGSVESVRNAFPEVKIIVNEKNEGFSKANNIGIKKSKGKYVCLSNTDIKILDNALVKMHDYMEINHRIGALLPKCVDGQLRIRQCCRDFPSLRNMFSETLFLDKIFRGIDFFKGRSIPLESYNKNHLVDTVPLCFTILRREAIAEVGLLDENFFFYGEDIDWCRRLHYHKWDLVYLSDASIIHYGGASSKYKPAKFQIQRVKATLQYWRKHHNLLSYSCSIILLFFHYSIRSFAYLCKYLYFMRNRKANYLLFHKYLLVAMWLIYPRR